MSASSAPVDLRSGAGLDAGPTQRLEQCRGQPTGIDRRLLGCVHAAVEGRREARLELAAASRRQPLGAEAVRALQLVDATQLGRLVAVEGDVQGAAAGVAGLDSARLLQLGDEVGIGRSPGDGQFQQLRLAEGELADGRQHSRRDPRGPGGGLVTIDHNNLGARLRKAPGAAEPDDPAADYHRVIGSPVSQSLASAGITRIRSKTVGGLAATLSALAGSRTPPMLPLRRACLSFPRHDVELTTSGTPPG